MVKGDDVDGTGVVEVPNVVEVVGVVVSEVVLSDSVVVVPVVVVPIGLVVAVELLDASVEVPAD